jgi:hypothetical protein
MAWIFEKKDSFLKHSKSKFAIGLKITIGYLQFGISAGISKIFLIKRSYFIP